MFESHLLCTDRQLYNATLESFSGAWLLLGTGLGLVQAALMVYVVRYRTQIKEETEDKETNLTKIEL